MKATLAILTIGVVPVSEVLPLLTEHVSEQQITHLSLLGKMSRAEVMEDYAIDEGDDPLPTLLNDGNMAHRFFPRQSAGSSGLYPAGGVQRMEGS